MPTLIISASGGDDAYSLRNACTKLKWEVVRVHEHDIDNLAIAANDLVVHGEPWFTYRIAERLKLKFLKPPSDWLQTLSPKWRARDVVLTTAEEARKTSTRAFIREVSGPWYSAFVKAKVYSSGADLPTPKRLPKELLLLVQEVVEWTIEFRCFVLNRKVVTLSMYRRDGREWSELPDDSWIYATQEELNAAREFCERVLSDDSVVVPEAVVIDVGIIANHGWAVIKSKAAFSSDLHGCDPEKVLPLLLRACNAN